MIWLPDLVLINAANKGDGTFRRLNSEIGDARSMRAIVTRQGEIDLEPLIRLAVSCG